MKLLLLIPVFAIAALVPTVYPHDESADAAEGASQEQQQDPGAQDPDAAMAAAMAAAAKFTQPGEKHELLKRFVGEWDVSTSFLMGGQKTPGESSKATASWLIDGRWLQMKYAGTLMGKPHEGFTLLGHDNFKQSYVMTMVSSLDTAMLRAEGDLSREGDALVAYGTLDEYLTGEHDKMVRYVWRFESDDAFVLEVHDLGIGEPNTQVLESRYTRSK